MSLPRLHPAERLMECRRLCVAEVLTHGARRGQSVVGPSWGQAEIFTCGTPVGSWNFPATSVGPRDLNLSWDLNGNQWYYGAPGGLKYTQTEP